MKPLSFKNLAKEHKNLPTEILEFNLKHLKYKLRRVQEGITFDERYNGKAHLLTDKAILRDNYKELIFDIETELKSRYKYIILNEVA